MSMPQNPFRPAKFEIAERHNIIWMSSQIKRLYEAQHFYVFGTRGSGKTSMLKALNWDERLNNPSVLQQIEQEGPEEFLGIYLRLPDYVSGEFSGVDWSKAFPGGSLPALSEAAFTLFLEAICLLLALEGIEGLRARGLVVVDSERENKFVARVLETLHPWHSDEANSLPGLITALRRCVRYIRRIVLVGPSVGDADVLPIESAGTILFSHLAQLRDLPEANSARRIGHFKICLDDCEMLNTEQQTYVNSLVRRSTSPVYWIISYVSPDYETTATTIPSQTLSSAERPVIDLDDEPEDQFKRFCEHVSAMRFWYAEHSEVGHIANRPTFSAHYFSLKKILGRFQVNVSLAYLRSTSMSGFWEKLEPVAVELQSKQAFEGTALTADDRFPGTSLKGHRVPPYYEAFVVRSLGKLDEILSKPAPRELGAMRAAVRRKQRAAWLVMCAQLGADLPFYGWQVVIALSDGCIRDYLEIMGELFDQCRRDDLKLADFRRRRVDITKQRSSIVAAGEAKARSIATISRRFTAEAYLLVSCLGHLTRLLQVDATTIDPIRSAELGIYSLDFSMLQRLSDGQEKDSFKNIRLVHEVVTECKRYGLLRSIESQSVGAQHSNSESNRYVERFRLHRRFAAGYGFSFRGPYGEVSLQPDDLVPICLGPDQIDALAWAQGMYRKIVVGGRLTDQEPLPLLGMG